MLIRFRDGGSFMNPFSMLDDFMSRDLTSFFGRDISELLQRNQGIAMPAVNVRETENSFQIELAAPGLRKEDFRINLDQNVLTISAQQETRIEEGPTDRGQSTTNGATAGGSALGEQAGATPAQPEAAVGGGSDQLAAQGQSSPAMQPRTASQPQRYTRREFSYSSFTRSFTLPETVDPEKISGSYENGILTVTVPKREQQAQLSRNIDIS